jgi:hypothetical protein
MPVDSRTHRLLSRRAPRFGVALSLILTLGCTAALGSDRPYDEAVERGRAALEGGEYSQALQDFMVALEMVDGGDAESWRMLLAIAVTYDQMGQLGHAAEFHRAFLMRAQKHASLLTPAWGKRVEGSKRDVDRIMKRAATEYGFVSVVSQPPGAVIAVDGRPVGAMGDGVTPFLLFLAPGSHSVLLTRSGYKSGLRTIKIAAGAIRALDVVMTPGEAGGASVGLQPVEEVRVMPSTQGEPELAATTLNTEATPVNSDAGGWTLVAGGGAALVAGAVVTALAGGEHSALQSDRDLLLGEPNAYADLTPEERAAASLDWDERAEAVKTLQSASVGLYVAGAAALLGGALWVWLSGEGARSGASMALAPTSGGFFGQASVRF